MLRAHEGGFWIDLVITAKALPNAARAVGLPDAEHPLRLDGGMQRSPKFCARIEIVALTHDVPMLW